MNRYKCIEMILRLCFLFAIIIGIICVGFGLIYMDIMSVFHSKFAKKLIMLFLFIFLLSISGIGFIAIRHPNK